MRNRMMRRTILALAAATTLLAGAPAAANATSAAGSWTVQPIPLPGTTVEAELGSISCVTATDCMVDGTAHAPESGAGRPLVEHRTGSRWRILKFAVPPGGRAGPGQLTCPATGICYMVGYNLQYGPDSYYPLIESWNGTSWSIMPLPASVSTTSGYLYGISCLSTNDCTAVGTQYSAISGVVEVPLALHWNGTTWTTRHVPRMPGEQYTYLGDVTCSSTTNCIALGGTGDDNGSAQFKPLAAHLSGGSWTLQTLPLPSGQPYGQLGPVSCPRPTLCYAVGDTWVSSGEDSQPLAEMYSAGTWTVQPLPAGSGGLSGLSCVSAVRCTAVGTQEPAVEVGLAYSWNGTSWSSITADLPDPGRDLGGISCVAAKVCTAVGQPTLVENENG